MTTSATTTTTTMEYTQMGKFVVADQETDDRLGAFITIENNIVMVGASYDDSAGGILNSPLRRRPHRPPNTNTHSRTNNTFIPQPNHPHP
jgi:hypothetical protein